MKNESNPGRTIISQALIETFQLLHGQSEVTETIFKQTWLERICVQDTMSSGGWYTPPENGLSVLFASAENPIRVNFGSLRDQKSCPSYKICDWNEGIILVYASHVYLPLGLPGDFATTFYLGSNPVMRQYFRDAFDIARQIAEQATRMEFSNEVYDFAAQLLANHDLEGITKSYTDPTTQNIGHTLPVLSKVSPSRHLTAEDVESTRIRRMFVNQTSTWCLKSNGQFTVEPQIIKASYSQEFPKLMLHYVVDPSTGVLSECEALPRHIGLL